MNEIGQRTAVTTEGSAFTGSPADGSCRYDSLGQFEKSAPGTIGDKNRSHQYDHPSRLVPRSLEVPPTSATRYLYDGWNPIAKYDRAGVLQNTFTRGLDLSGTMRGAGGVGGLLSARWATASGSPTYYPTYDGNGNVSEPERSGDGHARSRVPAGRRSRQYLKSDGTAALHYEYDPFGTLTRLTGDNSTLFQYRFSTKPIDPATGLYYYGYRWYDPLTGRWPSRDPIGEGGGLHLYGFVGNDGVSRWDILGFKCCECDQAKNPIEWRWGARLDAIDYLYGADEGFRYNFTDPSSMAQIKDDYQNSITFSTDKMADRCGLKKDETADSE